MSCSQEYVAKQARLSRDERVEKACGRCHAVKPIDEFSVKSFKQNKRSSECRDCHQGLRRSYYVRFTRKEMDRARANKTRIRLLIRTLKGTMKCARCPEDHPATFHFHHLDPTKKEFTIGSAVEFGFGMERILREIAKCETLCANCHSKEHYAHLYERDGQGDNASGLQPEQVRFDSGVSLQ